MVFLFQLFVTGKLTGGSAVVPVNAAYSRNTSCGRGPSMTNTSMMPLSDIQCVSTWGTSSFSLKNDISEFNMDWKTKEEWNTKGLRYRSAQSSNWLSCNVQCSTESKHHWEDFGILQILLRTLFVSQAFFILFVTLLHPNTLPFILHALRQKSDNFSKISKLEKCKLNHKEKHLYSLF